MRKKKYLGILFIVVGVIFIIGGFILSNKNVKEPTTATQSSDGVQKVQESGQTNNQGISEEVQSKNETENNIQSGKGTTFNGKLVVNVTNYSIEGQQIIVNLNVQNNYDKELQFWPEGIYIMNENGKRFEMDIHKQLANGGTDFRVVPGENRDFTFYLTNYTDSKSLKFKLDKIWCMGPECMKNTIEISIK